jgi:alkyl sulfatase BDS1-like metallo-beta-lactamase superfamily hydrolase
MKQDLLKVMACAVVAVAGMQPAQGQDYSSKPASGATIRAQQAAALGTPKENEAEIEFASRGFIGTRADPLIKAQDGKIVWNLAAYDFVAGEAPATVHPSLWRHMKLLRKHGLYKVADGVWQVRGFDLSNMTVIAGKTGWIIVDPLTTTEVAAAAMQLVNDRLGSRPIKAIIYSHSHGDHYGGVRGIVDQADVDAGRVSVIAPEHFLREATSENVIAGAAMARRVVYMHGVGSQPGPTGMMGGGIGPGLALGTITLIKPTDTITRTGETRNVDGVDMEFQIVSGSEAPSELNLYLPAARSFLSAEMSTCSLHNILTPRGAKVRDALAWTTFLDEALILYGKRSDSLISSHCWPRFGTDDVRSFLADQRDNYRFLHDQTVRRMNQGATMDEIAESMNQPASIGDKWFNRGYYGTYNHNSKAIYQFYLGWFDGNPANLHRWPPVERAKRSISAMGGGDRVIALARAAMEKGDYRWSSDLLNQLQFAEPDNVTAKALLADSLEQQGYQAESAAWRNQFLVAASELRGAPRIALNGQSIDVTEAIDTQFLLDTISTRFNPAKFGDTPLALRLTITDRNEIAGLEATGPTLIGRLGRASETPDISITAPRRLLLGLFLMKMPLEEAERAGLRLEGNRAQLVRILSALDGVGVAFPIVEP